MVTVMLAGLLLSACSPRGELIEAQSAIASFHAAYNRDDYPAILNQASGKLSGPGSTSMMLKILRGTKAKLGAYQSGQIGPWRVNYETSGKAIVVTNKGRFRSGPAIETFVFVDVGGAKRLAGYQVNSPVFIPQ